MTRVIRNYITLFSVSLFITTLNVEAGKLKKAEGNFSEIEASGQELVLKLDDIKSYIKEIDKPGSLLKKTFEGITHAWYVNKNSSTITTRYPLTKRKHERNIRNVRLKTYRSENWRLYINLDFNTLYASYGRGKLFFDTTTKRAKENWIKRTKKAFIKKGVEEEYLIDAVDEYDQRYVQKIENFIASTLFRPMDNLYENVYYADLGMKKLRSEFYSDDERGRKNRILNDFITHNEVIKRHKEFLIVGTMHAAYSGSTPTRSYDQNMDFKTLFKSRHGQINLGFKIYKQRFRLMGDSENEIYSKQNDFIGILDEYVGKNLAIKSVNGDVVQYLDASSTGKYKGKILYDLKKNVGEWIPPMWSSENDLKKIQSEYKQVHKKFLTLCLEYLDTAFNNIAHKYTNIQATKTYSNEF